MKKKLTILLMIFSLLLVSGWAFWVHTMHTRDLAILEQEQNAHRVIENPAPPDPDDLARLHMEPFQSHLPVIMIDTEDQQIVKEEKRFVKVAVFDDPSGVNDIMGSPTVVLDAKLKLRGASSHNFDKPQYRMNFVNEKHTKPVLYDLGGLGEDSAWILNAPYLDRSLMRNYIMYKLSGEIMDWAPDCRYCEVFVNGRYMGVYLILEPISAGASRLRISDIGLLSGACGYIVARDRVGTQDNTIVTYGQRYGLTGNELGIRYPKVDKITERQKNWIRDDIDQFEEALYTRNFDDPNAGYASHIDMQSFVDYFILNELSMNQDSGNLSTYLYKKLGGKMKLCVWDFNNGFDNYQWFPSLINEYVTPENYWFDRMCQDVHFIQAVEKRYFELRKGPLSNEHMDELMLQARTELGDALDRNFMRWGYTFQLGMLSDDENGVDRDDRSYEGAVQRLRQEIYDRLDHMDAHLSDLYEFCIN